MNWKNLAVLPVLAIVLSGCGGGGGGNSGSTGTTQTTTTTTTTTTLSPIPVQKSSYLNAKNNGLASQAIPVSAGGNTTGAGFAWFHAYGFADFFQDGSYSMVTHSTEYYNDPNVTGATAVPGHIKFWKKDAGGNWVDQTSTLLTNTVSCLLARKVVVADFNGDGKPDVFFACTGYDATPYNGEHPHLLLSQPDGKYSNITLNVNCYCHGASAADFNNDGYSDILVADFTGGKGAYFLKNNKDGTFTVDQTRLPVSVQNKPVFSAELIDFNGDGKFDTWLAGNEPGSVLADPTNGMPTTIFFNDGTANFKTTSQVLPADTYGLPLDVVFDSGNVYMARTTNSTPQTFYTTASIQKVTLTTNLSTTIYNHTGAFPNTNMTWIDWITISGSNIITVNSLYGLAVAK